MIYIASPYTSPDPEVREVRARAVMAFCAVFVHKRPTEVFYSPIAAWHEIVVEHQLPKDAKFWQAQNFGMLRHAKELWVLRLTGWEESKGIAAEIKFAMQCGLQIRYFDSNCVEVV